MSKKRNYSNILQATLRLFIACSAAILSGASEVLRWFLSLPKNADEEDHKESFEIEAGMFVHKVGPNRTIVDTLEDEN